MITYNRHYIRALSQSSSSDEDELSLRVMHPGDPLCTQEKYQPPRPPAPFIYSNRRKSVEQLEVKKPQVTSPVFKPMQSGHVSNRRRRDKTISSVVCKPFPMRPIVIRCAQYQDKITYLCPCKKNETEGHSSFGGQAPPLVDEMEVEAKKHTKPGDKEEDELSEYLRKCSVRKQ